MAKSPKHMYTNIDISLTKPLKNDAVHVNVWFGVLVYIFSVLMCVCVCAWEGGGKMKILI